jgi:lantibiotic modifying enzyme
MARANLVDAAKAVAVQVTSRAREQQRFVLPTTPFQYSVFTPGFFRGLSGIGYQLLRIAYPERLPSVLSFEPYLKTVAAAPKGQS